MQMFQANPEQLLAPMAGAEKHQSCRWEMRALGIKVIDPVLRVQYKPEEKDLEESKRLERSCRKGEKNLEKVKLIARME